MRRFIADHGIEFTEPAQNEIKKWREREKQRKEDANISFDIRQGNDESSYLDMDALAHIAEGRGAKGKKKSLWKDAVSYKPVRNAVGHTGLLTTTAKSHLHVTHENIKARVKDLVLDRKHEK